MNERIEELAVKAYKEAAALGSQGVIPMSSVREVQLEKFAESLIQEAIAVMNKRYMGDQNREDMEVRRCVEDLKKHFGVE
jgi:hypothetical protein